MKRGGGGSIVSLHMVKLKMSVDLQLPACSFCRGQQQALVHGARAPHVHTRPRPAGDGPDDGDWDLSFSVYHTGLVSAFRKL